MASIAFKRTRQRKYDPAKCNKREAATPHSMQATPPPVIRSTLHERRTLC
jgi:hypothetical protein